MHGMDQVQYEDSYILQYIAAGFWEFAHCTQSNPCTSVYLVMTIKCSLFHITLSPDPSREEHSKTRF